MQAVLTMDAMYMYMYAPAVLPWRCCIVTELKRKDLQGENYHLKNHVYTCTTCILALAPVRPWYVLCKASIHVGCSI